ncbi:ABC transporter substrate-binding protein [Pararhizobium sp. YC-54]|uniref:ABC transporter substrate-binding protein n=1 Tax=Pararhizobium sp. YC-54 TaxID=2986920 RepID=UPI0021F7F85B|nr:ABC transporter substrate-binding protein [Pararhizobium sp. YC-54]MCW0001570.1 ABC transporter substrate-binding protein [Pararhizobium sp. YC-54]
MFYRKHLRCAALTAALLMPLTFIGNAAAEDGTLVVAYGAQPPSFDPHVTTLSQANTIARNIFETLVTLDADLNIQPGLAQSWVVSEDGRKYRFTLRHGVKFHDGQPLTPNDVVASLQRWGSSSLPGKNLFHEAKWSAEGSDIVTLDLPSPRFDVLVSLAPGITQSAVIMPASVIAAAGEKPVTQLIGTGPFRLIDWQADRMMELERYNDYTSFGGKQSGTAGDRTPTYSNLRIEFVKDEATRSLGLSTGEYDIANQLPFDSAAELQKDDTLRVDSYPGGMTNLGFNYNKPGVFEKKEARQAVDIGIERQAILTAAAVDPRFFRLNNHLMMRYQKQWPTDVGETEFNPNDTEAAKKLLQASGYKGQPLVLITTRDYADMYNAAIVLQQQLQGLGLNVKLESYDWSTYVKTRADKNAWDLVVNGGSPKPDPTQLIFLKRDFPGVPHDAALEDMVAKFQHADTIAKALDLYRQLETWNQNYVPSVRIGETDYVFGMSKRVEGLQVQDDLILWTVHLKD